MRKKSLLDVAKYLKIIEPSNTDVITWAKQVISGSKKGISGKNA